ncbi:MAG: histidinol-phosphate transaminase [Spirochaetales bacterium]|nr:histidinol-phosphate transaminase [Spirochaetales bacterium]
MLSERMSSLTPYTPGEQPRDNTYIKLNTNENAYGPSPKIHEFLSGFDIDRLRLYPDPLSRNLRQALADEKGVDTKNVFLSNSSDEALSFTFYAFFDAPRGNLLFPTYTYSFYPVYAGFYDIPFTRMPLADDYSINLDDYLESKSCGVILPNPNAPTGIALPISEIKRFLDSYPQDRVVVIDEAYIDFGAESSVSLINDYPNLLVVGTFSKGKSLAALRLGFAIGQEGLIQAISTVKDSFNSYPVDILAQHIGVIAIKDREYYQEINGKIMKTRDEFTKKLDAMGWKTLPSKTNFLFTRKAGWSGEEIYKKLKDSGFLVRYFNQEGISDFVRITIGTDKDMKSLEATMDKLFS